MIAHFLMGFSAPMRGAILLWQTPRLRRLAVLPFIMTTVIFIFGLLWGIPTLSHIISFFTNRQADHGSPSYLVILEQCLLWPVGLMALLLALLLVSRILAGPFYSLLADATLIHTKAVEEIPFQLFDWLGNTLKISLTAVFRSVILAGVAVLLFLLSLIPGLAILTSIAFLVIFASDLVDYSLDSYRLGLNQRLAFMRRNLSALMGLGLAMGCIFLIPGLCFILMPVSIVGAADVVRRLNAVDK